MEPLPGTTRRFRKTVIGRMPIWFVKRLLDATGRVVVDGAPLLQSPRHGQGWLITGTWWVVPTPGRSVVDVEMRFGAVFARALSAETGTLEALELFDTISLPSLGRLEPL